MRHNDQGKALRGRQFEQIVDNDFGRLTVQVAGGLVGQKTQRRAAHGSGNGDTLAFAAGKLTRQMIHAVGKTHGFEQAFRSFLRDGSWN